MRLETLKKNREFKSVYQLGKCLCSPYTVMYYIPNEQGFSRIGFSVSKRIGNSVKRHRIKRLYRETVRLMLKGEEIKEGVDLVLVARKKARRLDFKTTQKDLRSLMKKGNIIKDYSKGKDYT